MSPVSSSAICRGISCDVRASSSMQAAPTPSAALWPARHRLDIAVSSCSVAPRPILSMSAPCSDAEYTLSISVLVLPSGTVVDQANLQLRDRQEQWASASSRRPRSARTSGGRFVEFREPSVDSDTSLSAVCCALYLHLCERTSQASGRMYCHKIVPRSHA